MGWLLPRLEVTVMPHETQPRRWAPAGTGRGGCGGSQGADFRLCRVGRGKKTDRFRLDLAAARDGPQRAAGRRDELVEAPGDAATARVLCSRDAFALVPEPWTAGGA